MLKSQQSQEMVSYVCFKLMIWNHRLIFLVDTCVTCNMIIRTLGGSLLISTSRISIWKAAIDKILCEARLNFALFQFSARMIIWKPTNITNSMFAGRFRRPLSSSDVPWLARSSLPVNQSRLGNDRLPIVGFWRHQGQGEVITPKAYCSCRWGRPQHLVHELVSELQVSAPRSFGIRSYLHNFYVSPTAEEAEQIGGAW